MTKKIYFGIILGLMVLGGVGIFASGQKTFSQNENRYLNTVDKIRSTEDVENAMVDQFAFRDLWLTMNSGIRYATGAREINGTYIGQDGYLFDACASWDFDMNAYRNHLDFVRSFAQKYDTNLDVVLVPSPYVIMADKLPAEASVYAVDEAYEAAQNALSFSYLVGDGTNDADTKRVRFIDLRERLTALAETQQVYYRTDHHWTTIAAREAYWEMGGQATKDELKLVPVTNDFLGTMYSRVQLPGAQADTIYALDGALGDGPLDDAAQGGTAQNTETAGEVQLYDASKLDVKDKYAFFLGGNSARADYAGKGEGKLLVIKDSFANCLVPFLVKDYETVTAIDLRFFNSSIEELMSENYDQVLVLYEMSNFASDTNLFKLAR